MNTREVTPANEPTTSSFSGESSISIGVFRRCVAKSSRKSPASGSNRSTSSADYSGAVDLGRRAA
jgi:hypothetical protein